MISNTRGSLDGAPEFIRKMMYGAMEAAAAEEFEAMKARLEKRRNDIFASVILEFSKHVSVDTHTDRLIIEIFDKR